MVAADIAGDYEEPVPQIGSVWPLTNGWYRGEWVLGGAGEAWQVIDEYGVGSQAGGAPVGVDFVAQTGGAPH